MNQSGTSNRPSPPVLSAAQRRRNQLLLITLWLVPFGLMGIAGVTYYLVQTGQLTLGSKNHGVLIQPPVQLGEHLADNPLMQKKDSQGNAVSIFDGHWTMVIRGDARCDEVCRDSLYLSRQLHIRLDKDAGRVQRLYLYDAPHADTSQPVLDESFRQFLDSEHRLLKALPVASDRIAALDAAMVSPAGEKARFALVDPQGWAMMYYLAEHEGNLILKDLKHLLKYSRKR